jgi:hypothetical protein
VGALFVSAFFLYGGGQSLVFSAVGDDVAVPANAPSLALLCAGSVLLLLNSAAVMTIGALAFRVLRRNYRGTANLYLGTRAIEAVLLALAPAGTLALAVPGSSQAGFARTLVENSAPAYSTAMAILGVGSIFFCWVLLKSGLLPRGLAAWGIAGYAIFALGSVLGLSGYEVELVMSIPGGLFEVAAGLYLLTKGFRPPMRHDTRPSTPPVDQVDQVVATSTHTSGSR